MAYRLYPVTKTETVCDDYKIKVKNISFLNDLKMNIPKYKYT